MIIGLKNKSNNNPIRAIYERKREDLKKKFLFKFVIQMLGFWRSSNRESYVCIKNYP